MDSRLDGPRVGRVLMKAAVDWLTIILATISVLAARWIGSWWPLVVGGGAVLAVAGARLGSPRFWRLALTSDDAARARLPNPLRVLDPSLRAMVTSISVGRGEIVRLVAETPAHIRPHVRFALTSLDELERCAARLVARAEILGAHTRTVRRESIKSEIARLEDRLGAATGEEAKREYLRARVAREHQLRAVEDILRTHERLVASLVRVVAIVDGLPSRIVRIRALGLEAGDDVLRDVDQRLDHMTGELIVSEHAVKLLAGAVEEVDGG